MAVPNSVNAFDPSIGDDRNNNSSSKNNNWKDLLRMADETANKFKFLRPDDDKIVPPELAASKDIGPDDVDALLARDLHQLSVKDRDQVYQEIHGVMDVVDEEPSMVKQKLAQLETELWRLSDADLSAYRLAHSINPSYTTDPKFRLQFLRSNRFVVNTAAERLARYFREKLILFGPEKVGKERITLDDLSDHDKESLSSGYMQWLPARDRTGRAVYFDAIPLQYWRERSNVLRALWYFISAALEDEETQKRGIIVVHYLMSKYDSKYTDDVVDRRVVYHIGILMNTLPVRVESMHSCCGQLASVIATKLSLYLAGEELRMRCRWHLGSTVEVLYAIAPFGIPVEMFPVKADGKFDMEPHQYWLESRRQIDSEYKRNDVGGKIGTPAIVPVATASTSPMNGEEESNASQRGSKDDGDPPAGQVGVVVPRPHDVLLGNLKVTQMQIGNAIFRRLIDDYRDDYERSTTKLEKMKISKKIIAQIKAGGARFLKQTNYKYGKDGRLIKRDSGAKTTIGWMEVPDNLARDRISHAFRNLRARTPAKGSATSSGRLAVASTNASRPIASTQGTVSSMSAYSGGGDSDGDGTGACCAWANFSGRESSGASGCFGGGNAGQSGFAAFKGDRL